MKRLALLLSLSLSLLPSLSPSQIPEESDYYTITPLATPEETIFEVSGIELLPDGAIAVANRRGEIWTAPDAFTADAPAWNLFANYLHEPLGLSWKDGWLYLTQRPEVTRIKDEDNDGRADIFETITDRWGINGDYHEYAFGTTHDPEGNIYTALCLSGSFVGNSLYRGWIMKVTPEGDMIPYATGVRSPGGIGFNAAGDLFYTDNQGSWNGTSCLKHVAPGSFQGNPNGIHYFDVIEDTTYVKKKPAYPTLGGENGRTPAARKEIEEYLPPAILLPHSKIGQSPTGIITDHTKGKFGPFADQVFVGEQTHSQIQRIFLEKVNGIYQGAAFHFLNGFQSGNIALVLSDDGTLFTGGSNRGWGAKGGKNQSFERVRWTGKVPFEILKMEALPNGFKLTFTQPIQPESLTADTVEMDSYTYQYQPGYGSPVVDALKPDVSVTTISDDGLTATLTVAPLTKGHVHELRLPQLKNQNELPLLHHTAYYTLNEIPK